MRQSLIFTPVFTALLSLGMASVHAQTEPRPAGQAQVYSKQYSLKDSVARALAYDPEYMAALAGRDAGIENESIALATLLPTISLSYAKYPNSTTESRAIAGSVKGPWSQFDYESSSQSLQVRQPILRLRNWASYLQGRSQAEQAEARLKFSRYQAVTRILTLHAEWLAAEKRLELTRLGTKTAAHRVKQIQAMRANSMASSVDLLQAQAEEQKARRDEFDARKEFEFLASRYAQIINDPNGRPESLAFLPPVERLIAQNGSLQDLQTVAIASNPELIALRLGVEAARWDVRKNQSDHLPTVDFVAQYVEEDNATATVLGRETKTTTVGFQVTVPLFQGGGVNAAIRQSSANLRRAEAEFDAGRQRVFNDLQRFHFALESANQSLRLARQQIEYSSANLKSIKEQRQYGLKSELDQLQAEQLSVSSQLEAQAANALKVSAQASILAVLGQLEQIEDNPLKLLTD